VKTLNELYSSLSTRRRYEVWFIRLGLADGAGAWWFRYLLMNPGRHGCAGDPRALPMQGLPVQVWATWFPRDATPQSFIQGFPLEGLDLSSRKQNPFHLRIANNEIGENSCRGTLAADGHTISWDLRWCSTFRVTLSNKGWIGFSRTPHSDAIFSGQITLNGRSFAADPLGFGVQGHNCGYRHRNFWTWMHAYFPRPGGRSSTLEALMYEMPFGFVFRKAVLWHEGEAHEFGDFQEINRDSNELKWNFRCSSSSRSKSKSEFNDGLKLEAAIDGAAASIHRLPYLKTDCKGTFEVANNSLAKAIVRLERQDQLVDILETSNGAVLEMVGL
jgi:hypothetical protein